MANDDFESVDWIFDRQEDNGPPPTDRIADSSWENCISNNAPPYDAYKKSGRSSRHRAISFPKGIIMLVLLTAAFSVALPVFFPKKDAGKQERVTEAPASVTLPVSSILPQPAEPSIKPAAHTSDLDLLYFRSGLTADELVVYDQICEGIDGHENVIKAVKIDSAAHLKTILNLIAFDHPEFFWYDYSSFSYHELPEGGIQADISPHYIYDARSSAEICERIEEIIRRIRNQYGTSSEYERVKGVFEYLVNNTVYDRSFDEQSVCQVLLDGRGVCTGYAKCTQLLLNRLGIQAILVNGMGRGQEHSWNIVRINGAYYQLDTTWGDPITEDGAQVIQYDYFCLTQEEMYLDHTPDAGINYPLCTAVECNYYRHEGRYFTECNKDQMQELFCRDIHSRQIRFKCANERVYREIEKWLIKDAAAYDLLERAGCSAPSGYSYSMNDSLYTIEIILP